jgi:hypothetical protein
MATAWYRRAVAVEVADVAARPPPITEFKQRRESCGCDLIEMKLVVVVAVLLLLK